MKEKIMDLYEFLEERFSEKTAEIVFAVTGLLVGSTIGVVIASLIKFIIK